MKRRHLLGALGAAASTVLGLSGCASQKIENYALETPVFDLLDEDFTYSDGTRQKRIWRLKKLANGRFSGRADDVVGEALGESRGNAFHWAYTLSLPVEGRVFEVQFDDWMYLMNDRVMLNKATMRKLGLRLGEVTLSFAKRGT